MPDEWRACTRVDGLFMSVGLISSHVQPEQTAFSPWQMSVGFYVSDGMLTNAEDDCGCKPLSGP